MKRTKTAALSYVLTAAYNLFQTPYTEEEIEHIISHLEENEEDLNNSLLILSSAVDKFNNSLDELYNAVELFRGIGIDRPELKGLIMAKDDAVDYDEKVLRDIGLRVNNAEAFRLGITKIDWVRTERNIEKIAQELFPEDKEEYTEEDCIVILYRISNILSRIVDRENIQPNKNEEQCPD